MQSMIFTPQDVVPAEPPIGTPSYPKQLSDTKDVQGIAEESPTIVGHEQMPLDLIDEACMESFPCSDPPCYTRAHA